MCCTDSDGKPFPKPISLPKPPYPPAARAVRASGEVIVSIKIDRNGKVTEASADNGHPLLKKTAEAAARLSRFESSETENEREVKLTYIFLSDDNEKKEIRRYSNLYRIEVIPVYVVISTTSIGLPSRKKSH